MRIALGSGGTRALIASRGAELLSLRASDGRERLWQGDPAWWGRSSPILFPFIGAAPGGMLRQGDRGFRMPKHGFARDREFSLLAADADSCRWLLEPEAGGGDGWPFAYRLEVAYRVVEDGIRVGWRVANAGTEPMPFSIGAHPAFLLPLPAGGRRSECRFRFSDRVSARRVLLTPEGFSTGERAPWSCGVEGLFLEPGLFEEDAIVLEGISSSRVRLEHSSGRGGRITVEFGGFPTLALWSPRGDCPFVCVEPWFGGVARADGGLEPSGREGMIELEPGGIFEAGYAIEIGVDRD